MANQPLAGRLDSLVTRRRFSIAVVFPIMGAGLLVASAEGWLPAILAFNPWLVLFGIIVMRLPLIAGLLPLVDRRVGITLLVVTGYVYGIEALGVATGWPYGEFTYGVALGPMVEGVPVGLPLFFLPLVLDAMLLLAVASGSRYTRRAVRIPIAVAVVIAVDLVLDPGAVALGFWTYAAGGAYYGVPWSNFVGWLLSAAVVVVAIESVFWGSGFRSRVDSCPYILDDLVSFVLLWGSINAFYGNWIPLGIVAGFALVLLRSGRMDLSGSPLWARTVTPRFVLGRSR